MTATFVCSFVASCFGLSAAYKLRDPHAFREAFDEFSLLRRLPRFANETLVWTTPVAECVIAILLIIPLTSRLGSVLAVPFAVAFVAIVALDKRPTISNCGCWGISAADVPKSFHVYRSSILLAAALTAVALGFASSGSASESLATQIEAIALTAPFGLLLLELPEVGQLVALQRLSGGVRT